MMRVYFDAALLATYPKKRKRSPYDPWRSSAYREKSRLRKEQTQQRHRGWCSQHGIDYDKLQGGESPWLYRGNDVEGMIAWLRNDLRRRG